MEFTPKSIGDLFNGMTRFRVPKYQRSFTWGTNQVTEFWKDVYDADPSEGFFFGTMILHKDGSSENQKFIVDGQQRMTSTSLLLLACRNQSLKSNPDRAAALDQALLFRDLATGEAEKLRLEVAIDILPAFKHMVTDRQWDEQTFPESVDGRVARRIKSIYKYFKQQVSDLSDEELTLLVRKLLNSFFLVIEIKELTQAFELFERTNARGTPLNAGELLKNRLFAEAGDDPTTEAEWIEIVENSNGMLPRMLKYFVALRHGEDSGRGVLYQHLRAQVEDDTPPVFINELSNFSSYFSKFINQELQSKPFINREQDNSYDFLFGDEIAFRRFGRHMSAISEFGVYIVIPVIYAGLHTLARFNREEGTSKSFRSAFKSLLELLATMECFHFINNRICTRPSNRAESLYASRTDDLTLAENLDSFKRTVAEISAGLKDIGIAGEEEFNENFTSLSYASPATDKPLVAYVFDRFETSPFAAATLNLFDPGSEYSINRLFEVEHVTPRSRWEDLYGDDDSLDNIGNLLPLAQKTNRLVDNKTLPEKIKIFTAQNCDHLRMVREFVDEYQDVKKEWLTPEDIRHRAMALSSRGYNAVWNPWP